ncbi:MAG: DUF4328 domain-containing protein [Acidimicrobiia bacterium]
MSDRPRHDDWWLASDGKWYPPELSSDPDVRPSHEADPGETTTGTVVSSMFTNVAGGLLTATSILMVVSSFFGLRYAGDLRSGEAIISSDVGDVGATEIAYTGWLSVALLMFVITGVFVLIWTYKTSKALDSRGPVDRRWRGGWTIFSWIIPFANFVIPKLVFNEIEKISQTPFVGEPIGNSWKQMTRTRLADLWWLLWVGGVLLSQMSAVVNLGGEDEGTLATSVTVTSFSYVFFAAAGVALALVMRRIELFSRR